MNVGYGKCRFCGIDPEIEKTLRDKDQLIAAAQNRKAEEERKKKLEEEKRERAKAKVKIFFRKHKKKILRNYCYGMSDRRNSGYCVLRVYP